MYSNSYTSLCQKCGNPLTPDSYCNFCNKSFALLKPNYDNANNNIDWTLVGISGAEVGTYRLLNPQIKLGREVDNDICIYDSKCSRHHALIRKDPAGIYIQDLNSSNGTYVNDIPITSPTYLKTGDLIRIGNTRFILESSFDAAQSTLKLTDFPTVNSAALAGNLAPQINYSQPTDSSQSSFLSPANPIPANLPASNVLTPSAVSPFAINQMPMYRPANQAVSQLVYPQTPSPAYAPVAPMTAPQLPALNNPQKTVAFSWLAVSGFALMMMGLPFAIDMDMMNGGFALIFISFFVMLMGIITSVIYFVRAKTLDKLLSGQELLAYWTYNPQEWQRYTEKEFEISKFEKVPLLILVSVISLIIGGIFAIADPEAGLVVFLVMLGLIALLSGIVFLVPRLRHQHNQSSLGYAYIGTKGLYLNGYFHNWNMLGASLDSASILMDEIPMLEIVYSFPTRTGRQEETVRVPIPQGQMAMAERIVRQIKSF